MGWQEGTENLGQEGVVGEDSWQGGGFSGWFEGEKQDYLPNIKNFSEQEWRQLSCVIWRISEKKEKRGGEI